MSINRVNGPLRANLITRTPPVPYVWTNTVLPAITGTVQIGQTLTCSTGTWTNPGGVTPAIPQTFTYRWRRNGVDIAGAAAGNSTYVVQTADANTVLSCRVTTNLRVNVSGFWALQEVAAYRAQGVWPGATETVAATSNNTVTVPGIAPVNTAVPTVSGTPTIGAVLTSTTGTWTGAPAPTYAYQWQRGTTNISGATSSTYTLVAADVNNTIRCRVTATNVAGSASAFSANTLAIQGQGQVNFTTVGTFSWTVPANVRSIALVCIGGGGCGDDGNAGDGGGGGGGGGGLVWANNVPTTPGATYTIVVGAGGSNGNGKNTWAQDGANSTFTAGSFVVTAYGGLGGRPWPNSTSSFFDTRSGTWVNAPGGSSLAAYKGGKGGNAYNGGGGGGGGAGYNGGGGDGCSANAGGDVGAKGIGAGGGGGAGQAAGTGSTGGGNGGAGQFDTTGGGGGGTSLRSSTVLATNGGNGNGLQSAGSKGGDGGLFGGGGGGSWDNNTGVAAPGGRGAVRIIWGFNRVYPNTNVTDV